jgi:hypothetical protein
MTCEEVQAIMGPPLEKVPWDRTPDEMWYYSRQAHATANFWRRWILIEGGKVTAVFNDFWID